MRFFLKTSAQRCEKWPFSPRVLMGVKMAVTKIKSADSKLKGIREKEIFATLSDVPASQNLPVKFSFRYLK